MYDTFRIGQFKNHQGVQKNTLTFFRIHKSEEYEDLWKFRLKTFKTVQKFRNIDTTKYFKDFPFKNRRFSGIEDFECPDTSGVGTSGSEKIGFR